MFHLTGFVEAKFNFCIVACQHSFVHTSSVTIITDGSKSLVSEYFLSKIEVLCYFLMQGHHFLFEVISVFELAIKGV